MGTLIPPLIRGVVRPLPPPGVGEFHGKLQEGSPAHVMTYEYSGRPGTFLVVCSQTCDIARDVQDEPVVEAMLVQVITKPTVLAEMSRSERRFVLDDSRGLVAVAPIRTQIDKKLLLDITPVDGVKDEETRRAFAMWLGTRYMRAAHPDQYIEYIRRPILAKLKELRSAGDERMISADCCKLRVFPPDSIYSYPPYDAELYFVMPDHAVKGSPSAAKITTDLASLAPLLKGSLEPTYVDRFEWHATPMNEMSAQDLIDTDSIHDD